MNELDAYKIAAAVESTASQINHQIKKKKNKSGGLNKPKPQPQPQPQPPDALPPFTPAPPEEIPIDNNNNNNIPLFDPLNEDDEFDSQQQELGNEKNKKK